MVEKLIGIVGGSGLYEMEDLTEKKEVEVETPFGSPSDRYVLGKLLGKEVAFLARHRRGHRLSPSELPFRANIYGFKKLGVEWLISASAVGSMREEIKPLNVVIPDQFFDRTKVRVSTFFGEGIVAHVGFADPFCSILSEILYQAAISAGATVHRGGTYLCIEGPQFSTRAESRIYRSWGVDVIGMTNLQEAKLAREAELCYATLAMVTDYDVWHESEEDVSVEQVVMNLRRNAEVATTIIKAAVTLIPQERGCPCPSALKDAIITAKEAMSAEVRKKLSLLIGKYL